MTTPLSNPATSRTPEAEILPLLLERWSPRSFTDEALPPGELERMLEAARWAPSANNAQPWRFLYALRGDAHWDTLAALPNERNQVWCTRAAALLVVLGDTASRSHAFDAGCAWGQLALQAHAMGWATHAMGGFDAQRAREVLHVPDSFAVLTMVAIGRRGALQALPPELQERERPSGRHPVDTRAFNRAFPSQTAG
jgi:nitroreductase